MFFDAACFNMFNLQTRYNKLLQLSALFLITIYAFGDDFTPDHLRQPYQDPFNAPEEDADLVKAAGETTEERIFRLKYEIAQLKHKIFQLEFELSNAESELKNQYSNGLPVIDVPEVAPKIPHGALVIISSEQSGGSGFIAEMRGKVFLITNIHVLGDARDASIQTLEGTEIALPSHVFVSRKRDVVIVPISWDGVTLSLSESLISDKVNIGDKVTVMGNSDGARVTTRLEGEIKGIGPHELQVSAKFVPGNSGSPIVHEKLGKVIAIASYLRDLGSKNKWSEDSELANIRRFGYRLDGNIEWQKVELSELYQQAEAFYNYMDRTLAMQHIAHMIVYKNKLTTNYQSHNSLGHLFEPVSKGFDWDQGLNSPNNRRLLSLFVKGMLMELQSDRQSTQRLLKTDFYQRRYLEIEDVRNEIAQVLISFCDSALDH